MTAGIDELVAGVRDGNRRALARAITLVESTRPDHRADADAVVAGLLPDAGGAVRVGISGPPGVGKSTLIEALGMHLADAGTNVAVLAVDPSSARSHGSVLGDKTRMARLAQSPAAFIRPSPSGGVGGGVARRTREAMLLCEAAGFEVVVVETVGVGQADTEVADMVDVFVLLVAPGGGDELQGIKRGVMELADVLVVTKADGDLEATARRTQAEYTHALALLRPKHRAWTPVVVASSAATGTGIAEAWDTIVSCHAALADSGVLDAQRGDQAKAWLWNEVRQTLVADLLASPDVARVAEDTERAVVAGQVAPGAGAARILDAYTRTRRDDAAG